VTGSRLHRAKLLILILWTIAFRATNTIQQQLAGDPSGIYKLKYNKCNKVFVGQSGRAIGIRFKEHIRYIRSNNSTSPYATHILENRHEYRMKENTLQLLKACQNRKHVDCWEVFRQQKVLIDKQQVNDMNPLFELAKIPYNSWPELYPVRHTSPNRARVHTAYGKHVT